MRNCYLQLRNIVKLKPMPPRNIAEQLIPSLIFSRLHSCNSLFTSLNNTAVARLQLVQNPAARLLTNSQPREHTTPVLAVLHWLPNPSQNSIQNVQNVQCSKTLKIRAPNPANCTMVQTENKGWSCFCGSRSNTVEQTPTKYQSGWVRLQF